MKKLRSLLSDTLIYGISSVLARFVGYLLVPLHTGSFLTSQYGVVSFVYAGLAFLNILFRFGMESAYLRYAKDREQAKDVFKTLQLWLAMLSTVLVLLLIIVAPLLMPQMHLVETGSQQLYWFMLGILWFDTISAVPFAELRLNKQPWVFALFKTGNIVVNVGLQFYLILFRGWGITSVFFASLVASVLTGFLISIVTSDMLRGSWKKPLLTKALRFGMPFIPAGLGFVINEMLDRFFLGNYMSHATAAQLYGPGTAPDDVVGIYSACYKLSVFMLLLVQMFKMAWQPFFLRESDEEDAPEIYRDVFRYFNVVAGICFLVVALFVQQIVQIKVPVMDAYLVDPNYWAGLSIVPILLGAYWFHGWYMNFSAGIYIKEKTRVLPVITLIGAAITIVANLLLIPYWGMMGAAGATLLSYASMALMLYYQSVKTYPVNYQLVRAFLMMGIAVACLLAMPWVVQWTNSKWLGRFLVLALGSGGILLLSMPGTGGLVGKKA